MAASGSRSRWCPNCNSIVLKTGLTRGRRHKMRAKRLIAAASVIVIAIGGLLFFNTKRTSAPTLVLIGYEDSPTNASATAKLELRNTTGRAVWLRYLSHSGQEFPLRPPLLERPTVRPRKAVNGMGTNIYSLSIGSFFMRGEKVPPGSTVDWSFRSVRESQRNR
jgi:hypothetical protein